MNRLLPLLLVLGTTAVTPISAQDAATPATPAAPLDPTFNPDPGATRKPAAETPFYEPPPGTPPDYQSVREPIVDLPHDPLPELNPINKVWKNREYPEEQLPPGTMGVPDRWYIDIPTWSRYNSPLRESAYMYQTPRLWDPYKLSVLKGDVPVAGQDIFLKLEATSFTSYEARDLPTPSGVTAAAGNSSEFFGEGNQQEVDQFFTFSLDLFKGETVFQPVTWLLHLQPVYNINYTTVKETGILSADQRGSDSQTDNKGAFFNNTGSPGPIGPSQPTGPAAGGVTPGNPGGGFEHVGEERLGSQYTTRTKDFMALQAAFLEFHLSDLSSNYDFISIRGGIQPFNSDFRGFVFNDTNLGIRVFGNADNNKYQYNVAAFDMREKDTYSELNTFNSRDQYVFIANVYRQDFLTKGYTAQLSFLTDLDDGDTHYDRTGFLTRPATLGGPIEPHDIRSFYFGWNGDGHWGRLNVTHSFYEVLGKDTLNGLAGQAVDINAQMGAAEISWDQDWARFKASFFYASGDSNPTDNKGNGFDTIVDNPNFVGGPFSYFVRQGFVFGNTAVNFKQRNSLVIDLRTSKNEGQANYVNPGTFIYGLGTDIDLLPTMKLFLNANFIKMAETEPINVALHTSNASADIGWDLSGGIQYRPLLTDNIIISAGLGALIPGDGYKTIYGTNTNTVPGYAAPSPGHVDAFLYSGFASVTFTY